MEEYGQKIKEMINAGYDVGDTCRECIETYGNPCCADDESECGLLDENVIGFEEWKKEMAVIQWKKDL